MPRSVQTKTHIQNYSGKVVNGRQHHKPVPKLKSKTVPYPNLIWLLKSLPFRESPEAVDAVNQILLYCSSLFTFTERFQVPTVSDNTVRFMYAVCLFRTQVCRMTGVVRLLDRGENGHPGHPGYRQWFGLIWEAISVALSLPLSRRDRRVRRRQ